MTKDEMKNRISMALKDPILQQGFEIICKDLAILEHDREHNDYELTEVYKKVEQLKKENAELKKALGFQTSSNMDRYFELKRSKEQLAKAKEIIKEYMIVLNGGHITVCSVPEENRCIDVLELNKQAEQFLSAKAQGEKK